MIEIRSGIFPGIVQDKNINVPCGILSATCCVTNMLPSIGHVFCIFDLTHILGFFLAFCRAFSVQNIFWHSVWVSVWRCMSKKKLTFYLTSCLTIYHILSFVLSGIICSGPARPKELANSPWDSSPEHARKLQT